MNLDAVWTITRKDLAEIRNNKLILYPLIIVPLMFAIFMPATAVLGLQEAEPEDFEVLFYLTTVGFIPLFIVIPAAVSNVISSYSFVGEKLEKTIEPLLATPLTDSELLLGKMLASFIPAIVATLAAFLALTILVDVFTYDQFGYLLLPNMTWILAIFLLSPLVAVATILVTIVFSARMNDPRAVQQMSVFVILPFIAIFFGGAARLLSLNENLMLILIVGVLIADRFLFSLAKRLFERETILTEWK